MFQHRKCKHTWAVISEPCGPGMGFTTCSVFTSASTIDGSTIEESSPAAIYRTATRPCPKCERDASLASSRRRRTRQQQQLYDLGHECMDPNTVRMVSGRGCGFKWGTGPAREDWGWEVKMGCSVM